MTTESAQVIRDFRDPLLRDTVSWCVRQSPFYRARFGSEAEHFRGLDDLPRLPVLFRDEAKADQDGIRCQQVTPSAVQYTTGTTGEFWRLYRSAEELQFIAQFYTERARTLLESGQTRPLLLALTSVYHGAPTPVPGWPYVVSAGMYDRTQAHQARQLLEARYDLPGVEPQVSAIIGGDLVVKAFTAFLLSQNVDLRTTGVRHLIMTGGYVSESRKQLLADLWNATVQDRYSMTEVFGGASQCGLGGPWIFDPEVVPEVVHPRTLAPVNRGIGTLVLTSLYPFVQMMPVVRYYTGDLVEVADTVANGAPDLVVRFLGRERRSVLDASGDDVEPLLLSAPFYDLLESYPEIAATERFADIGAAEGLEFAGKLRFSLDIDRDQDEQVNRIHVVLGLRYVPWLYPDHTAGMISRLRNDVYDRFPTLRDRVARRQIDFHLTTRPAAEVGGYNMK